jgi:hypothetical protein
MPHFCNGTPFFLVVVALLVRIDVFRYPYNQDRSDYARDYLIAQHIIRYRDAYQY